MKTAQLYLTRDEYHAGGLQGLWAVGVFPTQPQENNGVVWSKHIHRACWWIVCISWSPVCFPLISPAMEQWMSPNIHTSCSACIVQSTDVSNPASLHHCCSTFLVLITQASLALSLSVAEMQQDFYPQSWHGSTVEMSRVEMVAMAILQGWQCAQHPENPWGCWPPDLSIRSKTDVKPVSFYSQPVMPQAGLLNYCGN